MENELIKLLIVDDDIDIREGLFSGIDWESLGYIAINQCEDGIDAIRKIEEEIPEVVLTDIRMDNMDGMELIDYLSIHYPSIKIILLSGYSDLDYYKKALEYKVFDFILKPTHLDDFQRVFGRLKKQMDEEKEKENAYRSLQRKVEDNHKFIRQSDIVQILEERYNNEQEFCTILENHNILNLRYNVFIIGTTFFYNKYVEKKVRLNANDIKEEIKKALEQAFSEYPHIVINLPGNHIITICKIDTSEALKKILVKKMEENIEDEYTVFSGISSPCHDLYQCNHIYKEALTAMKQLTYIYKQQVIVYDELKQYPQAPKVIFNYTSIINSLFHKYDEEWLTEIEKIMDMFKDTVSYDYGYLDSICNNLYHEVAKYMESISPNIVESENFYNNISEIYSLENKKEFIIQVLRIMSMISVDCKVDRKKKIINQINKVIDDKYLSSQLSLTYLSEVVGKSTAYISNLYKQETNMNINDVITNKRMEYAKKLLKETNLKTYKIAEEIGYADCSYFTKLFKKQVGLSPNEYRNTLRK